MTRRFVTCLMFFVTLTSLGGCGDPLVSGSYPGEIMASIDGFIIDSTSCITAEEVSSACLDAYGRGDLVVTVLWANRAHPGELATSGSTELQTAVAKARLPSRFGLDLHTPPPESVLSVDTTGRRYAWGLIAVFTDVDGDRQYTRGVDVPLGGSDGVALIYTEDGATIPGGDDGEQQAWPAGFSLGKLEAESEGMDPCNDGELEIEREENEPDETLTLTISIDVEQPTTAWLPDTNCDGSTSEWPL